ncbi:Amino acid permease 3 [Rhynchospora pubera]|nr:Amino acid permease 3 [Rhynchospora pubera]
MGEEGFGKAPLLIKVPDQPDEGIVRTGTQWSATAHIITAVIGSGVLSLAWSVGQLGWVGGPISLVAFAWVTTVQSSLLADCYKSPDPEHGPIRNRSYMEAVKLNLGERSLWVCGFFQQTGLFGCAVAYTLTAATSMR